MEDQITLKENTGSYFLDIQGTIGGSYRGKFVFRGYLTPIEAIACDREFRDLIGAIQKNVDPTVEFLAFALTQLHHRIVSAPPFWNAETTPIPGGHIADRNVIETLLEAATATEKKYRESLIDKHEFSLKQMEKQLSKEKSDLKTNKEFEASDAKTAQ